MIELEHIYGKLINFLENLNALLYTQDNLYVFIQFENPFVTHQNNYSYSIWVKPPVLEEKPEPSKHWRVPAVIAGPNPGPLLVMLEKIPVEYSPASYWRKLRPLPPEEIGIWDVWYAFAVDLYIDFNHLCEL